jgi:putative ABC transport system permease protein
MFKSLLLLGFRNLFRKNKLFTAVNIAGLGIGLSCVLLVAMFIYDEYSFDSYHKNNNRIYRIVLDFKEEGNVVSWARTSAPIGNYLRGKYPEVENVVRVRKNPGTDLLSNGEIKFFEERIFFADSTLFKVFDFPLVQGSPRHALQDKNSVVLTETLARKYFNEDEPVGKTLRLNNNVDLKVTGVLRDIPANSHFVADAFVAFSTLDDFLGGERLSHWGWMDHYTYILLSNDSKPESLQFKFPEFIKSNAPEWVSEKESLYLQPLTSIHLHSDRKDEISPNSRESYSYVLGTIALFILLMACANFINLSTATLVSRAKEISIQKILGASKIYLIVYFWIESILVCSIALLMSYGLVAIALPYFNLATGKGISLLQSQWLFVPSFLLTTLIALLSGVVPAIQSARINLVRKATAYGGWVNRSDVRTALITFQFSVSILLIICTGIVSSQFSFLKSARVGFNGDNVLVIPVKDRAQNDKHVTIANELSKVAEVQSASFGSSMPAYNNAYTYTYTLQGSDAGEQAIAAFLVDENFIGLYDIKLKDGRLPIIENRDTLVDVILNQAAVDQFNLSQPIGSVVTGQVNGKVVGVVENFNYESLHSAVKPMIMYSYPRNFRFVSVKFNDAIGSDKIIAAIDKVWKQFYPGYPLEFFHLSDRMEQLYTSEFQLTKAYTSFSMIAVTIAGVGLIGLTTYLTTRRLKELSIRKVFGGSTFQLIGWIYSGYFKIVVIATLAAWAIGYYWMKSWLAGFAFKTDVGFSYFAYPSITMILVLLLTTVFQTIKASRTNPVDHLRDE